MSDSAKSHRLEKSLALVALVVGVAAGSYGVASAASGSSTNQNAAAATTTPAAPNPGPPGATPGNPWGGQRSDETLLTGDTATKVKDAALAKLGSDSTIIRVETDADGHAAYEAHAT